MRRDWRGIVWLAVLMTVTGGATAQVTVPNLVGQQRAGASELLRRAGLVLGTSDYGSSANQQIEHVYRQNPAVGTSVARGSGVNVVIAKVPSPAKSDPVWPWGTNPGDHSAVTSFCDAQQALMDNDSIARLLSTEYAGFLASLAPGTGDINGISFVILKDPYPDGDLHFELNGNGKNDCHLELRLIGEILADPNFNIPAHGPYTGLTHAKVLRALNVSYEQLEQDVGSFWPYLCSAGNGLPQVLLGHMLIGDGDAALSDFHDEGTPSVSTPNRVDCSGSAGFVKAAMFLLGATGYIANPQIDLNSYARMPEFFATNGDADGDGITNACEYNYANDPEVFPGLTANQRIEKYVEFALDPNKAPRPCYCTCGCPTVAWQSPDHQYHAGENMALSVWLDTAIETITYVWDKDGVPIEDATGNTYFKEDLVTADSGVYRCTGTNQSIVATCTDPSEASVTATMVISVTAEGALPVATAIGLGALVGMLLGCGGLAAYRKRR